MFYIIILITKLFLDVDLIKFLDILDILAKLFFPWIYTLDHQNNFVGTLKIMMLQKVLIF